MEGAAGIMSVNGNVVHIKANALINIGNTVGDIYSAVMKLPLPPSSFAYENQAVGSCVVTPYPLNAFNQLDGFSWGGGPVSAKAGSNLVQFQFLVGETQQLGSVSQVYLQLSFIYLLQA
jgi:hypothetical protein